MVLSEIPHVAQRVAFYAVIACWWVFGLTFWLRKRPPSAREAKRDRTSLIGLLLQAAGYLCVWSFPLRQRQFLPVTSRSSPVVEWGLAGLTVALAVASAWLVNAAARHLGKQWALAARLVEGHTLIQDGPYRFVRNPIYTGMFGLLVATGLAMTQPKLSNCIARPLNKAIRWRDGSPGGTISSALGCRAISTRPGNGSSSPPT